MANLTRADGKFRQINVLARKLVPFLPHQPLVKEQCQLSQCFLFILLKASDENLIYYLTPRIAVDSCIQFLNSKPKPAVFLIVRNPLDRILSAYRDKLERCSQCNYLQYMS